MEASCIVVYQLNLNPLATMDGSILYSSLSVLPMLLWMEASCIVFYQFYLNPSATMDGSILYSSLSVLFLSALSSSDFIEILMI